MGRKARVRAAKKAGEKPGPAVRPVRETKTIKRLRKIAPYINTLAQFEQMVKQSTNPAAFRRLLTPMLRVNIPCCAEAYLATRPGVEMKASDVRHSDFCPTRNLVQDVSTAIVRPGSVTDQLTRGPVIL